MADFVLIHGASHGAWCWYKVARRLEAAGHRVVAPDMPGHGADRSPSSAANMDNYAERTCEALNSVEGQAVLVGHSMGGLIISHAAEQCPDKVAALVYLCAFLVADGESLLDQLPPGALETDRAVFVPDPDSGLLVAHPERWRETFYGQCSEDDVALARLSLVPQNPAGFSDPVRVSQQNFGRLPRHYIECLRDQAIPIPLQRIMVERMPCQSVQTLDSDHSPFFSHPDKLAGQLLQIAAQH